MSSLGNAFDPGNYGQSSHLKLVIEEAGRECLTGFVQDLIIKFLILKHKHAEGLLQITGNRPT